MNYTTSDSKAPVVIKVGGKILSNLDTFWADVRTLKNRGPVILVHGGGSSATALARRLGHAPRMIQGRRVTTRLDLQTIEWALRGGVSLDMVGQALAHGLKGVGLSGADGGLLTVVRRTPWTIGGKVVDFGHVGDVASVDPRILTILCSTGYLPIIAPIGVDAQGKRYNVNADTVAAALAKALQAHTLILVTETGGVRRHAEDPRTLIPEVSSRMLARGQEGGWISDGMYVKGHVAVDALRGGVGNVYISAPTDIVDRQYATQIIL